MSDEFQTTCTVGRRGREGECGDTFAQNQTVAAEGPIAFGKQTQAVEMQQGQAVEVFDAKDEGAFRPAAQTIVCLNQRMGGRGAGGRQTENLSVAAAFAQIFGKIEQAVFPNVRIARAAAVFVFGDGVGTRTDEHRRVVPAFRRPSGIFGGAAQMLFGNICKSGAPQAVVGKSAEISGLLRLV